MFLLEAHGLDGASTALTDALPLKLELIPPLFAGLVVCHSFAGFL
jgi:hypothetical protein